jgi:hypothetical protein
MACVPGPAVAGLKTPDAFTPVPDQVPPAVPGVNVTGASEEQSSPGEHILASQQVVV